MWRIMDQPASVRGGGFTRREWMRVGGLGFGGLTLPTLASGQTATDVGTALGRAKSVIVMFLGGGPPQHETWDTKPEAPAEIRGGFGACRLYTTLTIPTAMGRPTA